MQGRGEWYDYDGTRSRTGPLWPKRLKKIDMKDTAKKRIKILKNYKGGDVLGRRCLLSGRFCSAWAGFFNFTGPVFLRVRRGYLGHGVCLSPRSSTWLCSGRLTCSTRTSFRAVTTPRHNARSNGHSVR